MNHLQNKSPKSPVDVMCTVFNCLPYVLHLTAPIIMSQTKRMKNHDLKEEAHSQDINVLIKESLKTIEQFNPLAYADVPETAGLARSINTQPAVRRNSETNPTSQHNRGMY